MTGRGSTWSGVADGNPRFFRCAYCSREVASSKGWVAGRQEVAIRICPMCNGPSFFDVAGKQWPGPKSGEPVADVPGDVSRAWEEARNAVAANAPTAAVMVCRKILMHGAVEKGAAEDQTFQAYVTWLVAEHAVPRGSEGWLDYVRRRGNDANHELPEMSPADAQGVLRFTEALLRNVFELPAAVPRSPAPSEPA